jgi:hypothetical protein
MDRLIDARSMAEALIHVARVAGQWADPQTVTALISEALVVLASEELEAELRVASTLPAEIAVARTRRSRSADDPHRTIVRPRRHPVPTWPNSARAPARQRLVERTGLPGRRGVLEVADYRSLAAQLGAGEQ